MAKKNSSSPTNPWTSISFGNRVYKDDIPFLQKLGKKTLEKIHFDLMPEAFIGNPDANVYFLNGTPGFGITDYLLVQNSAFVQKWQEILTHSCKDFWWISSPLNLNIGGFIWWKRILKDILRYKSSINGFDVEIFPYHAESMVYCPNLPSMVYSKFLIEEAMKKNKLIIILRAEKKWYDFIPNLISYHNRIVLKNPRNPVIFKTNCTNYSGKSWNDIVKMF